jgi:hypothetical protein
MGYEALQDMLCHRAERAEVEKALCDYNIETTLPKNLALRVEEKMSEAEVVAQAKRQQ